MKIDKIKKGTSTHYCFFNGMVGSFQPSLHIYKNPSEVSLLIMIGSEYYHLPITREKGAEYLRKMRYNKNKA